MDVALSVAGSVLSAGIYALSDRSLKETQRARESAIMDIQELHYESFRSATFPKGPVIGHLRVADPKSAVINLTKQSPKATSVVKSEMAIDLMAAKRGDFENLFRPQITVQEDISMKFTDKMKMLSDLSFGCKHIRPSMDFLSKLNHRPLSDFKTGQGDEILHGGSAMRSYLQDRYGLNANLHPQSFYRLRVRELQGENIYLFGQKRGDAFFYDQMSADPTRITAKQFDDFGAQTGRVVGIVGFICSVGFGLRSKM
jgi:hypothetical protein